jgi:CheY-like chemotaxis protein
LILSAGSRTLRRSSTTEGQMNEGPCKVLVIDDERDNVDTNVELLRFWGHEAEAAYSADDALSKAKTLDPDVVLMDIMMPAMNGFDLAKELRRYCPQARFVALTGYTRADIVRRARDAGFAKVIRKPAPAEVLEDAVQTECAVSSK